MTGLLRSRAGHLIPCYRTVARFVQPPDAVPCAPMPDTVGRSGVPAPDASSRSSEPSLIHARGLTKRFGDFTAVDAVDFDVAPGESFGFLGPNGAGKTSTMRMIGCVSPMTSGQLLGHGHGPEHRRAADPRPDRRGPAAGHARHRADGPREPAHLRPLLRPRLEGDRPARRRAHRVRPADRARQRRGRAALGRHEATPHDRPGAHQRARACSSSTSRRPASTRRRGTSSGTGCTGSSSAA